MLVSRDRRVEGPRQVAGTQPVLGHGRCHAGLALADALLEDRGVAAVRAAEQLEIGDTVRVRIQLVDLAAAPEA